MKKKSPVKIIVIVVLIAALLAGGVFGGIRFAKSRGGEVNVYPVAAFSTSAEWMDGSQTDGIVSTDRIQSVYVSNTQQVTEIFVKEGQTVKIGDPILAFDTTLSDLALERQGIKIEQLRLDIKNAEDYLREIGTYRVGSPAVYTPVYEPPVYTTAPYMPYDRAPEATGTFSDPLIWLWDDGCVLDEAFFLRIAAIAAANRALARERLQPTDEPTDEPAEPEEPAETEAPEEPLTPEETSVPPETEVPAEGSEPDGTETPAEGSEPGGTEPDAEEPEPDEEDSTPDGEDEPAAAPFGPFRLMAPALHRLRLSAPEAEAWEMPSDEMSELDDPNLYIVFEVRTDDAEDGDIERVWEMVLYVDAETLDWSARFIAPVYDPGESSWADVGYDDYYVDTNVYYSAAEIAQMKAETNQKIKDLNIQLKAAEVEYDRLEYELTNGEVLSRIDGVVKTVRDPDEARAENRPAVMISGGGGYYVTAVLGELDLGTMQVGETVTVQSWENYQMLEGTITEISEYPDESGRYWFYSQGNQNVSTYPFKVFVDEDAELRDGEYVSISYGGGAGGGTGGLYLEQPFIRQEGGKSYVYTVGEDGLLEKRYVLTGKNLWGSYIEILGGLTYEDSVAFPYGRQVRDGAKVRYAEPDELWAAAYGIG